MGSATSSAFAVGCISFLTRTNMGSSNALRIFDSAWLIEGWLSCSRSPALETLRVSMSASKTTSKLRSSWDGCILAYPLAGSMGISPVWRGAP